MSVPRALNAGSPQRQIEQESPGDGIATERHATVRAAPALRILRACFSSRLDRKPLRLSSWSGSAGRREQAVILAAVRMDRLTPKAVALACLLAVLVVFALEGIPHRHATPLTAAAPPARRHGSTSATHRGVTASFSPLRPPDARYRPSPPSSGWPVSPLHRRRRPEALPPRLTRAPARPVRRAS